MIKTLLSSTLEVSIIEATKKDVHLSDPSATLHLNISTVHYKPTKEKNSQMLRYITILNKNELLLAQDWWNRFYLH